MLGIARVSPQIKWMMNLSVIRCEELAENTANRERMLRSLQVEHQQPRYPQSSQSGQSTCENSRGAMVILGKLAKFFHFKHRSH